MNELIIHTHCYFDGLAYHDKGPYRLHIKAGQIDSIVGIASEPAELCPECSEADILEVEFLMPGLVEAHCHLFLDGGELDFTARSAYLKAERMQMLQTARRSVEASRAAGITLIRDAGDRYGINHAMRQEYADHEGAPVIRSPGLGLRQPKKYGAFMAREVSTECEIREAVAEAAQHANDLKILLTGIIDFEAGAVTSSPQFDLAQLKLMLALAADSGLKTFAHCSGLDGLKLAVEAGVDSIEHGFFMTADILEVMAQKQIAWVPTFSPVHFQWLRPELANWSEQTIGNLRRILDDHLYHVEMAHRKGVPLVAGSDAGSYGVCHGSALIDELGFFLEAGVPMLQVLQSATSRPRRLWNCQSANITAKTPADFVVLGASPFEHAQALRDVRMTCSKGGLVMHDQPAEVTV